MLANIVKKFASTKGKKGKKIEPKFFKHCTVYITDTYADW